LGTSLRGGGNAVSSVTLGGVAATIVSESSTTVVVVAGQGTAGVGHIVVTSDTGAFAVLESAWTYLTGGQVLSFVPTLGQYGTLVTVTGSNFLQGGQNIVGAFLAGVPASVVAQNDSVAVPSQRL